jgi:transcriptional regulator with XRE-family HTH domain
VIYANRAKLCFMPIRFKIKELCEKKAQALGKKKITQEELAVALDEHQSIISRLSGSEPHNPSLDKIEKLIRYFQCSFDDLFELTNKSGKPEIIGRKPKKKH